MKDRISLYPGRVELTPVPGQTNVYDMIRADEPQEVGTPLNKATLLKDDVAMLLGLDPKNATPNDVFEILLNEITTIRNTSVKVVYGAYNGNNATSKTFTVEGIPIYIALNRNGSPGDRLTGVKGETYVSGYNSTSPNGNSATATWGNNTIKLTQRSVNEDTSSSLYTFNASGSTYYYMIIYE